MFMYQSIVLLIALRYIMGKSIDRFSKNIYWIANISITLGVMATITVLSIMNGFQCNLKQNLLNFIPHALLTTTKGYVDIKRVPDFLLSTSLYNTVYIQPLVISDVILQSSSKVSSGVMLGVEPSYVEPLFDYLIFKRKNQLIASGYYIIIGSELAKQLDVHINNQIRLIVPSVAQITPLGYIPSQRLFTVLDIYTTTSEVDAYQVLVHQSDASALMHYPLQYMTGWRLWLHDPLLKNNYYNTLSLPEDWVWKDWKEYKGFLFQAMEIEKNIMSLLLSLIIIVAGFNVVAFLILLIFEKKMEIAILQTYGLTCKQIILLFMFQGISNGIFGVFFGTILGVLLSYQLNRILSFFKIFPDLLQFSVEIRCAQILIVIFITFIVVLLSTLYSSLRAISINPAQILRHD